MKRIRENWDKYGIRKHQKPYTIGDEYRLINWKATAKANRLMVNQFQGRKVSTCFIRLLI